MTTAFFSAENDANVAAISIYEIVTTLAVGFFFFDDNRIGDPRSGPSGFIGWLAGEPLSHFKSPVPFHQSGKFHR